MFNYSTSPLFPSTEGSCCLCCVSLFVISRNPLPPTHCTPPLGHPLYQSVSPSPSPSPSPSHIPYSSSSHRTWHAWYPHPHRRRVLCLKRNSQTKFKGAPHWKKWRGEKYQRQGDLVQTSLLTFASKSGVYFSKRKSGCFCGLHKAEVIFRSRKKAQMPPLHKVFI